MSSGRGRYLWYELLTTDPAGAQDFYTKLIGWGLEKSSGAGMDYTMWTRAGTPIGGVLDLPAAARGGGVPSHLLAANGTPDGDATTAGAKKKGRPGDLPPQGLPAPGRFCLLRHPHRGRVA